MPTPRVPDTNLETIIGQDPPANTESIETVPPLESWDLHGYTITLTTSAAAGIRNVNVVIDDGTTEILRFEFTSNILANRVVTIHIGLYEQDRIPVDTTTDIFHLIRIPLELGEGWRIRTSTGNIQAGDDYGPPKLFVKKYGTIRRI